MQKEQKGYDVCRPLVGSYLTEITTNNNRHIDIELRLVPESILGWDASSYTITDNDVLVTSQLSDRKDILNIYADILMQMYQELAYAPTIESAKIDTNVKVDQTAFKFDVKYDTDKNSSLTMHIFYHGNFYLNVAVAKDLLRAYVGLATEINKKSLHDELGKSLGQNTIDLKLRARNRKDNEEK